MFFWQPPALDGGLVSTLVLFHGIKPRPPTNPAHRATKTSEADPSRIRGADPDHFITLGNTKYLQSILTSLRYSHFGGDAENTEKHSNLSRARCVRQHRDWLCSREQAGGVLDVYFIQPFYTTHIIHIIIFSSVWPKHGLSGNHLWVVLCYNMNTYTHVYTWYIHVCRSPKEDTQCSSTMGPGWPRTAIDNSWSVNIDIRTERPTAHIMHLPRAARLLRVYGGRTRHGTQPYETRGVVRWSTPLPLAIHTTQS